MPPFLAAAGRPGRGPRASPKRPPLSGALFVGWGLVGFCPGPALASLAYGRLSSVLFVAAMLLGMTLYRVTAMPRA